MPKKTHSRKQEKSSLDQRFEHFSEEVEKLGNMFADAIENKCDNWDSWFHNTLGVIGPLISSVFGIIILVLIIWISDFISIATGSGFLSELHAFLLGNLNVFFVIFIFFSYMSYLSKACPRGYKPFSPLSTAVGITTGLWIAMQVIRISNLASSIQFLSSTAVFLDKNLFWIFGFFLVLGYIIFSVKIAIECPVNKKANKIIGTGAQKTGNMYRLYRSGKERILGGVCGGIAEYLGVDPVLIRLLWIIGTFAWGFGILLYIIAWIIIPRNPKRVWD